MAKWFGMIGYAETVETAPDVWDEIIKEHAYYGDVIKNTRRLQSGGYLHDDINIANEISILSDPFAYNNFHNMRYVTYLGTKWKVTNIEVQYPRLILSLGGVYND